MSEKLARVNEFSFQTSEKAWAGLNEYVVINELKLAEKQGINKFTNQLIMNDTFVHIEKSWVSSSFDFGRMFGYKIQKWTSLVRNYVDLTYLDLIRADIASREAKKSKNYSISFHFSNSHSNGKDCLISLVFSRRPGHEWPILNFHTRATELTKRFLIDLLLVHRIGEYIYGRGSHFSVNFFAPYSYITAETFTMYDTYRSIPEFISEAKEGKAPFQSKILTTLDKYKTVDPMQIRYKSYRRAALQLQVGEDGLAKSKTKPLLAGGLFLRDSVVYPENCISLKDRKKYLKSLK